MKLLHKMKEQIIVIKGSYFQYGKSMHIPNLALKISN